MYRLFAEYLKIYEIVLGKNGLNFKYLSCFWKAIKLQSLQGLCPLDSHQVLDPLNAPLQHRSSYSTRISTRLDKKAG